MGVLSCDFCCSGISASDLEEGRAVHLLSDLYCPKCILEAVENSKSERTPCLALKMPASGFRSPAIPAAQAYSALANVREGPFSPAEGPLSKDDVPPITQEREERRGYGRYVPPFQAELSLRMAGLPGLLIGNMVRFWLEISEGGVRAIVSRKLAPRRVLKARIFHKSSGRSFDVGVSVRHVSQSHKYPGAFVVGFRFVEPSPDFMRWVRESLCLFPAVSVPSSRKRESTP
jgi:hypothetical protein